MKVSARGSALEPHGRGLADQQARELAAAPVAQQISEAAGRLRPEIG
jgi:hypothetical protein